MTIDPKKKRELEIRELQRMRRSPIYFVKKVFKLVPQPIKPEFKELVMGHMLNDRSQQIRPFHFEPFIRGKHITWQQWILLMAVGLAVRKKAKRRITVRSGHGTGKSSSIALLVIWYLFCHKNAQVPCTAPTAPQMHDILWKEISLWLAKLPEKIKPMFLWSTEYIRIAESPQTWFARARTASKENPEALAGVHADYVMVLVDEASGVVEEVYNTAEGSLSGPNTLVILISNGTRLTGYFYDSHHIDSSNWQTLHFDGEESPIVDQAFIDRIANKHGKDSDEYAIRVKGGFGAEEGVDDQGYVPLLVEQDLRVASTTDLKGLVKLGIDPAGDGGDAMAQVARDRFIAKVLTYEKTSTPRTIAKHAVTNMVAHNIEPEDVGVDNFGIGANVPLEIALARPDNPVRVNGVNVGDDPEEKDRFMNLRAELAWRMREWIKGGGEIVGLEHFREELLALRFRRTAGRISKIQLMDKRTMKKLGLNHGKSPNRADALMLTFLRGDTPIRVYEQPEYEPASIYGG
jgi:hypothetical protein